MKNVALAAGVAVFALLGVLLAVVVVLAPTEQQATSDCTDGTLEAVSVTGSLPASVGVWKGEQLTNAAAIINAGAEVGISRAGQTIGVMTAMGESGLRVLDYGDAAGPDSRGLFQQRANGAWGSLADRMNPRISAMSFFRALMRVPGWQSLPPTIAAHRTQINADPYYYEPFFDDATEVVAALVPAASAPLVNPVLGANAAVNDPYRLGQVQPQLRALVAVLAPMFDITAVGGYRASATDPDGHPAGLAADFMVPLTSAGRRQGDALAAYARTNAAALGVDYILWKQRIWSVDRVGEGWRSMKDRGGPTENHLDHVHINVKASTNAAAVGTAALPPASCVEGVALPAGAVVYPVDKATDRGNWNTISSLRQSWHTGTDFSIACATPVVAAHAGTVSIEGSDWAGPYLTKISTGPTSLTSWYAHMQTVTVKAGDVVAAGQQIGTVGSLGNSTGCHLHFEVHEKNGPIYGPDNVNPTTWLAEHVGASLLEAAAVSAGRRETP